MALGYLATSFLVVACILFRAPDVSQVHLELDGIRFDLGQQGPEVIFCEHCHSAAFECQQSCAEFLFEQEHKIAGWGCSLSSHLSVVGPQEASVFAEQVGAGGFGPF